MLYTTPQDLQEAVVSMTVYSASGTDSWNSGFIKKCKTPLAMTLTSPWRDSLDFGVIPKTSKLTHITPLYKGRGKAIPKNYQPITLTNII